MSKETPGFRIQGGKSHIRDWVVGHLPRSGNRYIELFAGRANVFFLARQRLMFQQWELYDKDASFLLALQTSNLDELPTFVTKEDFLYYRESDEPVAALLAPEITYAGNGYARGNGFSPQYRYEKYRDRCQAGQDLLRGIKIQTAHWEAFDFGGLTDQDLIYLDPPYLDTIATYENIAHFKLVGILNELKTPWVLSGYNSDLYDRHLKHARKFDYPRNLQLVAAAQGFRKDTIEVLWRNF